jgi:hypothetical protein
MSQPETTLGASTPRLDGLSVAVVGAGRIGVELIDNLARMGVGRIDVYDCDTQAVARLSGRYVVHEGDVWDELTLARLRSYDFAVCTIDDDTVRRRLNQKCLVASVSLLQTWTDGALAIAAAYPFGQVDDCACAECDSGRVATPMPIAQLKLSVAPVGPADDGSANVETSAIAGGLTAALLARIATGAHGPVARHATLDTTTGRGTSFELRRDRGCPRCHDLQRPVPIVHTRNRWHVQDSVARACPESLAQSLQLSDELEGMPGDSFSVADLVTRYRGGPVPAKFALTCVGNRTVCLDFEDCRPEPTPDPQERSTRPASG